MVMNGRQTIQCWVIWYSPISAPAEIPKQERFEQAGHWNDNQEFTTTCRDWSSKKWDFKKQMMFPPKQLITMGIIMHMVFDFQLQRQGRRHTLYQIRCLEHMLNVNKNRIRFPRPPWFCTAFWISWNHMEISQNGGTLIYHPFLHRIFHDINHPF